MAIDNTHTKYLKGNDKKAWEGYKDAYTASKKLENFANAFKLPNGRELEDGEEFEIPLRKDINKKK